jgi:hypothetical protein
MNLPVLLLAALAPSLAAGCAASEPEPAAPRVAPPRPAPSVVPSANPAAQAQGEGEEPAPADPEPATEPAPAESAPQAAAAPGRSPAGWVAGKPLPYEEILEEWHRVAPREVFLVVEKLITARLALAEASRLGIRLVPEVVDAEVEAQIARFRADVAKEAPGRSIDEFVRGALGVEPARYWERIREGVIRQMLAERAVRSWALSSENATVRLIVVATEEEARAVADELQAGADFAELAAERSLDETGAEGGLIPFLVRQEQSPLARAAFASTPGEVVGPLPAAGHHFLVRVEEVRPPIGGEEGSWPDLKPAVEESLRVHPVVESEFLHWKLQMERRYPVDLAPLLDLIGAAEEPATAPRNP